MGKKSVPQFKEKELKNLLCASTKKELKNQIEIFENLIKEDAECNKITINKIKEELYYIFKKNFENLTGRIWIHDYLKILNVSVCPYCNRNYVNAVYNKQKPDLDHYFPKGEYPYLAVSIFNLIPCCSSCNRGKSNKYVSMKKQHIMYPFEESFGDEIRFITKLTKIQAWYDDSEQITINMNGTNTDVIEGYNDAFKIDALYANHVDYAREIAIKSMINSEEYIKSLFCSLPRIFRSLDDAKITVYGNYISEKDIGKRSLAKLTHDLLKEITNVD